MASLLKPLDLAQEDQGVSYVHLSGLIPCCSQVDNLPGSPKTGLVFVLFPGKPPSPWKTKNIGLPTQGLP